MMDVRVEAIAPPEDPPREETQLAGNHRLNDAVIGNINPAVMLELGLNEIADAEEGVVVLGVARGSIAGRIVSPGDILIEINEREIEDVW